MFTDKFTVILVTSERAVFNNKWPQIHPNLNRRFSPRYDDEVTTVLVFRLFYFNPYLNPLFLRGREKKKFRQTKYHTVRFGNLE